MQLPTLTLIAAPYGLGPASKAIAVAHASKGTYLCTFVGSQAACTIAANTNLFDHIEKIDYSSQYGSANISCQNAMHTIFINTTRFISNRAALPGKLYMVDTLAWMRTSPPTGILHLQKYYAQAYLFTRLAPSIISLGNTCEVEPIIVDPTQDATLPSSATLSPRILVQVGGMGSPATIQDSGKKYLDYLVTNLQSLEADVTLILPPQFPQELQSQGKIQLAVATPLSIGSLIRRSDLVLTTSGIEFMYECAARRIPMLFLPPFNATQEKQLFHLAQRTPTAVLFPMSADISKHKFEDLDKRTQFVQTDGQRGMWQRQFHSIFSKLQHLSTRRLNSIAPQIRGDQGALFASSSFGGAQYIVESIRNG